MYLWRKRANPQWLRIHEENLEFRFGSALATVDRPGKMRTIVQISCRRRQEALELQRELGGVIEKLPGDWLRRFAKRSEVKPIRLGSRTIVIPAEAAFGTGEHATTAMCLRMLERLTRGFPTSWSMFDAGTGSGILAIAGSRLGATHVVAMDNDPLACSIAQRNARANRVSNIDFRTGDVLKVKPRGKFDIITANLFSEILIAALPVWLRHLAPNGLLILSGVLRSQERALVKTLSRNSCFAREIRRRGKWIAVLASPIRKRS